MREHKVVVGWICVVALLGLLVLSGCPQKAEETAGVEPMIDQEAAAPPASDEGEPAAEAGAATDMGVTMAEIMAKWPASFTMKQTITDADGKETVETTAMKVEDGKPAAIRAETPQGAAIIDFSEGVMYSWESGSDTAMKIAIPEGAQSNPYEDVDATTKIVGEDIVGDVECWVTETTRDDNTTRMWWGKDDGLMRRVEAGDSVGTFEYEQIGSVPDSEFELPAGMSVQEMPEMPDMPDMPEMPNR